jgi:hypothetical protein
MVIRHIEGLGYDVKPTKWWGTCKRKVLGRYENAQKATEYDVYTYGPELMSNGVRPHKRDASLLQRTMEMCRVHTLQKMCWNTSSYHSFTWMLWRRETQNMMQQNPAIKKETLYNGKWCSNGEENAMIKKHPTVKSSRSCSAVVMDMNFVMESKVAIIHREGR